MAIYHYAHSPVALVNLREEDADEGTAQLFAGTDSPLAKLAGAARALSAKGMRCVPVTVEGHHALEVRGVGDKASLLRALRTTGLVQGAPKQLTAEEEAQSWKERLEKYRLQACGVLNLIADVSYFMSGFKGSKAEEKQAGMLYFGGSTVMTFFGKGNAERHLDDASRRLAKHLHKEGIELPESCCISQIHKEKRSGMISTLEDLARKYPSEIGNAAYSLAGMRVMQSGLRNKEGIDKIWDIGAGTSTMISGAGAAMIPQKTFDTEHPKRSGLMGVYDWIQEKPNRLAGYGMMVATFFHAASAYREYRHNPAQKSYIFKAMWSATNIMAEVLMAGSSKGHGGDLADIQSTMMARAAELIAQQPEREREALVHHIAGFFASQGDMHGTAAEYTKELRQKVAEAAQNPWMHAAVSTSLTVPSTYVLQPQAHSMAAGFAASLPA